MAQKELPDERLVYLHCRSIFSKDKSQVRREKVITKLLESQRASIKILTKEFKLAAIAAVAKHLLEQRVFESLPRAKLKFPELFQPSETQEAERAASEEEALRAESEAAHEVVLTSDDEAYPEQDHDGKQSGAEIEGNKNEKGPTDEEPVPMNSSGQPNLPENVISPLPKLHPVYLPFKTQHTLLNLAQSLLEECCFEYGKKWVPEMMVAHNWHEVESIELTQWTKRFLKYIKPLPPTALTPIPTKSMAQVLFGTSSIRHSAVHRLPTSAAGIINMLSAAITFTSVLNDSVRTARLIELKVQLEASIEEIVQNQRLLERKLTDQLQEINRRRAELDQLERSTIEEMLSTDREQRAEIGSALDRIMLGSDKISNAPCCKHAPLDETKMDYDSEEESEIGEAEYERQGPDEVEEEQANAMTSLDKANYNKANLKIQEYLYFLQNEGPISTKEKLKVAAFGSSAKLTGKEKKRLKKADRQEKRKEAERVKEDQKKARKEAESKKDIDKAQRAADKDRASGMENSLPMSERLIPIRVTSVSNEQHPDLEPEDVPLPDNELSSEEVISREDHSTKAETLNENFSEELKQNKATVREIEDIQDQNNDPSNDSNVLTHRFAAPESSTTATMLPPTSALQPNSASASASASTPPAPAPPAKPLEGSKKGEHMIIIRLDKGKGWYTSFSTTICEYSRTAILDKARSYIEESVDKPQWWSPPPPTQYQLTLLQVNDSNVDLRGCSADNLSYVIQMVENLEIPTFTVSYS